MSGQISFDCVLGAWREHETELRRFLAGRCSHAAQRIALLHDNVRKYATVFNTVAPGAALEGTMYRAAPA